MKNVLNHAADTRCVLAIDLGTSALKAALVTEDARILADETVPLALHHVGDDGVEQDPREFWDACVLATQRLVKRAPEAAARVGAVSVTGQWSGTVVLDAQGEPLGRALIWMDARGAPHVQRQIAGWPSVQGYGAMKLWRWIQRTGGAPARSGKDPLGHILFLAAEEPVRFARARLLLEPVDFLTFKLTGRAASTSATMTLHWVTDNRDLSNVRYDERLLRLAGLDRARLPELLRPSSIQGPLRGDVAALLGLPHDAQVIVAAPDLHTATLASGAIDDFEAHVSLGTSSWLCCHVPYKKADLFRNMASLPSALPDRYLLVNEQESAGACLHWLQRTLNAGTAADEPGAHGFDALCALAALAPPGCDGAMFLPWLNGERAPVDEHRVRGGFLQLSLTTTPAHLVRAVLEGVAYNTRWLMGHVEAYLGRRLGSISVLGGGATSALWCQILADVLARPIAQVAEPRLANVRGAALLGAHALGWLERGALADLVPIAQRFEPNAADRPLHDQRFEAFRALYPAARALGLRLAAR